MIKVAGIQMKSNNENVEQNRKMAIRQVKEAAKNGAKLIALPELWVTGYELTKAQFMQHSETIEGKTIMAFQQLAQQLNVVIIVPFAEKSIHPDRPESMYISAAIIDSDGTIAPICRKSMLWGKEKNVFTQGDKEYSVYSTAVGKIGVLICYDIEFPEPARLLALQGADLIVVSSVWSKKAENRWDIQLPARALDNSLYVLGVNAAGGNACGKSKFIDPYGEVVVEASKTEEQIIYGHINNRELQKVRQEIPYRKDYPLAFTPGGVRF